MENGTVQRTMVVVLLSLLLTATVVPYAGSMPAQAATDSDDCKQLDKNNSFFDALSPMEETKFISCVAGDLLEDSDVSGLSESEAQQTLHSQAASIHTLQDNQLNSRHNYLKDSRWTAMSEGRIRAAKALDNHKTESKAKYLARQRVADYYGRMENNSAKIESAQIERIKTLYSIKNNENISYNIEVKLNQDTMQSYDAVKFVNGTTELENGKTINVTKLKVINATGADGGEYGNLTNTYNSEPLAQYTCCGSYLSNHEVTLKIVAKAPNSYNEDYVIYDGSRWMNHYQGISDSHTYVNNNIDKMVTTLFNEKSASEIDGDSLLYPTDVARQSASAYAQTGSLASFQSWVSMRGYKTDLQATMTIQHKPVQSSYDSGSYVTERFYQFDAGGNVSEVKVKLTNLKDPVEVAVTTSNSASNYPESAVANTTVNESGLHSLDVPDDISGTYYVYVKSTNSTQFYYDRAVVLGHSKELQGALYTRATPSTTNDNGENVWKVNQTYNAFTYSEPVYVGVQDSEKVRVQNIDGEFTIKEIYNRQKGEYVNSSNPEHTTYKSTSYTDVQEQNEDMTTILQNSDQDTSTGALVQDKLMSWLPSLSDIPIQYVVGVVLFGGILLALTWKTLKKLLKLYIPIL